MRLILFLFLLCSFSISAQISQTVIKKFEHANKLPCLIYLKNQADLSSINSNLTKTEKANLAFNQLFQTATKTQGPIIEMLSHRNRKFLSYYIVNLIRAELTLSDVQDLMSTGLVRAIVYDSPMSANLPNDLSLVLSPRAPEITWGLKRMNVETVWNMGFVGQGVVVGGADTGDKWDVDGIKEKYRGYSNDTSVNHNYSWYDAIHDISPLSGNPDNPCGINLKAPCDDHGHGTHTKGTMVGSNNQYLFGVAPAARWIGCRNMERGNGAPSTYIECFQFFIAPTDVDGKNQRPDMAPHVINNSWYCSLQEGCDTSVFPIMEQVVKNVKASGVVVVVSAGNDGANCYTLNHTPAIHEASFTTGAFARNDTISSFSSVGPVVINGSNIIKPNVCAPGSEVISQLPDGSFAAWSGTSMAGPHNAGLVALIISANPSLAGKVDLIENIIEETAEKQFPWFECAPGSAAAVPNYVYGHGLIQADAAVIKALLVKVDDATSSPTFDLVPNPGTDFFFLKFSDSQNKFQMFDICGILLSEFSAQPNEPISTNHLVPGVYILRHIASGKSLRWIKN